MRMQTAEDFERAHERLRRRDSDSLAAFVMSLATQPGPVGEQVRTFIVGDDLAQAIDSLRARIGGLAIASEYEHRHALGREMGASLDFIVDSVERLVLPIDANAAFELLAALFAADAVAMENCGEHDWEVACAYERAVRVMAAAAKDLPRGRVEERVKALIEEDGYGTRAQLARAFLKTE
ncbi:MAG TPA: hypothetical protein VIY90_13515 [Steroidobacteraceae bacterium]